MKLLVYSKGNRVWLDVAVQLYESGVAKPVLWTGDDRHFDPARKNSVTR